MAAKFKISRSDGRSNAQVILDLVKDKPAGTIFAYSDLADSLSVGTNTRYEIQAVRTVVIAIYPRMLKEQARALHNIRNVGYRLAPASHHVALATGRQAKADKQMLRGIQTLQNVRWDEMDANQRMAHEGQLLVTSALYQQMQALERRQSAVEDSIKRARGKGDLFDDPAQVT